MPLASFLQVFACFPQVLYTLAPILPHVKPFFVQFLQFLCKVLPPQIPPPTAPSSLPVGAIRGGPYPVSRPMQGYLPPVMRPHAPVPCSPHPMQWLRRPAGRYCPHPIVPRSPRSPRIDSFHVNVFLPYKCVLCE